MESYCRSLNPALTYINTVLMHSLNWEFDITVNSIFIILLCAEYLQHDDDLKAGAFYLPPPNFCFSSALNYFNSFFKYLYCNIFYQKYFFHGGQSSTYKT